MWHKRQINLAEIQQLKLIKSGLDGARALICSQKQLSSRQDRSGVYGFPKIAVHSIGDLRPGADESRPFDLDATFALGRTFSDFAQATGIL
ncbi:MAG: hypothetical protein ACLQE9_09055 [Roseiarcus sp.]